MISLVPRLCPVVRVRDSINISAVLSPEAMGDLAINFEAFPLLLFIRVLQVIKIYLCNEMANV